MRQRNDRRFETPLVTCRHVHVAKLCVRRRQASPGTHRDERAVAALLPGTEPIELLARALAQRIAAVVDVPVDMRLLAGEPGARVERSVGPDRVRVLHVHVARAVVDAVGRGEAVPLGFLAQERHLVVERIARVAGRCRRPRRPTSCTCRSSGLPSVRRPGSAAGCPCALRRCAGLGADDRLEVDLDELVGEVLLACRNSSSAGIAVDRALVEVAADRDAARGRRRGACSR